MSVPDMFEQHKTVTGSIAFLEPESATCLQLNEPSGEAR
ncbi:hypothetical protein X975_01194, partial [Stegodyphus mimosarum]